jgi:hypothetical protein
MMVTDRTDVSSQRRERERALAGRGGARLGWSRRLTATSSGEVSP